MDAKLYLGKVHIVEWLRPRDRRTGGELLDELEPLGIVSKPQVLTQLHRIATRADFLGVLRGIEQEFRATARCAGRSKAVLLIIAVSWPGLSSEAVIRCDHNSRGNRGALLHATRTACWSVIRRTDGPSTSPTRAVLIAEKYRGSEG